MGVQTINPDDIRAKVFQILTKKGYSVDDVTFAYSATEEAFTYEGTFNALRKDRIQRVLEHLQKNSQATPVDLKPVDSTTQDADANNHKKVRGEKLKVTRVIWEPDVTHWEAHHPEGEGGGGGEPLATTTCSVTGELQRMQLTKKLRNFLHKACEKAGVKVPLLVFERWLARASLCPDLSLPLAEPLLPSAGSLDRGLVKDLVRGGVEAEAAEAAARGLQAKANQACERLVEQRQSTDLQSEPRVCVCTLKEDKQQEEGQRKRKGGGGGGSGGGMLVVSLGEPRAKPYLTISTHHYTKLWEMFRRHDPRAGEGSAEERFQAAVWCLLARYAALHGHGYQAALTNDGFKVLLRRMGVNMECFASPLNCRYSTFCSAFPDTDASFGSRGSFFNFYPTQGSFEANPPFVPEVMSRMLEHMEELLAKAQNLHEAKSIKGGKKKKGAKVELQKEEEQGEEKKEEDEVEAGALSFTVLVPHWPEVKAIQGLKESKWNRASFIVPADKHVFCDGAQHQRSTKERFRPSSFDTFVVFLQTDAGARKWSVTDDLENELQAAMRVDESQMLTLQEFEHRNASRIPNRKRNGSGLSTDSVDHDLEGSEDNNVQKKRKVTSAKSRKQPHT